MSSVSSAKNTSNPSANDKTTFKSKKKSVASTAKKTSVALVNTIPSCVDVNKKKAASGNNVPPSQNNNSSNASVGNKKNAATTSVPASTKKRPALTTTPKNPRANKPRKISLSPVSTEVSLSPWTIESLDASDASVAKTTTTMKTSDEDHEKQHSAPQTEIIVLSSEDDNSSDLREK